MKRQLRIADPALFVWITLATLLGLFFIFDAGYAREIAQGRSPIPSDFRNQLVALPFGLAAFCLFSMVPAEKWKRWSKGLWIGTFISLFLVYAPIIGHPQNGANRWIKLPILPAIQPAEFAKLTVILFLAGILASRDQWKPKSSKDWATWLDNSFVRKLPRLWPAFWIAVAVVIIEKEPDLGTAAIVASVAGLMFFVGGIRWNSLIVVGALGLGLVGYLVTHETYRMDRIDAHNHRWDASNVDETGYQTVQSELGMAQGGWFGVGPGGGRAKHVMPAATTDFMLATVAEETGFVGAMAVLTVLGAIAFRLLTLAKQASTPFGALVLTGFAAWIGVQTGVNVLMANGALPAIGVPLPFLSYGGSSLMALWMAFGVSNAVLLAKPVTEENKEAAVAPSRNRGRNRRARLSRA